MNKRSRRHFPIGGSSATKPLKKLGKQPEWRIVGFPARRTKRAFGKAESETERSERCERCRGRRGASDRPCRETSAHLRLVEISVVLDSKKGCFPCCCSRSITPRCIPDVTALGRILSLGEVDAIRAEG